MAPAFPARSMVYRPDIDGLRGFAVLAVVAYHAFPQWVWGGFIGVDIFFVISGYLITGLILDGLAAGHFRFSEFFARRIRRLFPAFILTLTASLVAGWFILLPDEYEQLSWHVVAGAGFFSNFVFWSEVGYFDDAAETKPLLHLWSLGIEEQFYLVWPILLWLAWRRRVDLRLIFGFLLAGSFLFALHLSNVDQAAAFYSPLARIWEFAGGGLLAWAQRQGFRVEGWRAQGISLLGLASLGLGLALIHNDSTFPAPWAILPVAGATLLIAAGPAAWFNQTVLANRAFVWIGLISYPLYLWHWPLLSFLYIWEGGDASVWFRLYAIAAAVLLAQMTYQYVENPIRRRGNSIVSIKLVVGMAIMGGACYMLAFQGYRIYWRDHPRVTLSETIFTSPFRNKCHFRRHWHNFKEREICEYFEGERIKFAVLGNSHGVELAYALAQELKPFGIGLRHYTMSGCQPSYIFSPQKRTPHEKLCVEWHRYVVESILKSDIDTIILSFRTGSNTGLRDDFRALIDDLVLHGKKVVWVMQAPLLQKHVNYYIRRSGTQSDVKATRREDWTNFYQGWNGFAETIKDRVFVIDPAAYFCDLQFCYAAKDNASLYYDSHHMSVHGAQLIARNLLPKVFNDIPPRN